jgi:hypothetical protein
MNKKQIEKYTETEIKIGKSKLDIFNKIVTTSDFNIHDVASIIRKVPTLEKRKQYKSINSILVALLVLTVLSRFISGFIEISNGNNDVNVIVLFFPIVTILLIYGVYKFKSNVHLVCGIFLIVGAIMSSIRLINSLDLITLSDITITIFGSVIAFYLNSKLVGDYELNKELQKTNPNQRENIVTFTE